MVQWQVASGIRPVVALSWYPETQPTRPKDYSFQVPALAHSVGTKRSHASQSGNLPFRRFGGASAHPGAAASDTTVPRPKPAPESPKLSACYLAQGCLPLVPIPIGLVWSRGPSRLQRLAVWARVPALSASSTPRTHPPARRSIEHISRGGVVARRSGIQNVLVVCSHSSLLATLFRGSARSQNPACSICSLDRCPVVPKHGGQYAITLQGSLTQSDSLWVGVSECGSSQACISPKEWPSSWASVSALQPCAIQTPWEAATLP